MTNVNDLQILYNNPVYVDPKVADWNKIQTPYRLLNLLSIYDIQELNRIATSIKLASRPSQKKNMITSIMENRGFKRLDCGTNRLVFKFMEDQTIVVKVAFDRVAISDNLREFENQEILKPYCTKCFEVSPCGTVGLFERVEAIVKESLNKEVIYAMYDVVYDIVRNGYLLDDFGGNYYKNWGIRNVNGRKNLVILDYPYVYEPDLAKLTCNNQDPTSPTGYCGGQYEYDAGFNFIRCEKCGKVISASELAKTKKEKTQGGLIVEREEADMIITIEKNGKTIVLGEEKESTVYNKRMSRKEYRMKKAARKLEVTIERGDHSELDELEKPKKIIGNTNPEPIKTDRICRVDDGCKKLEVTVITSEGDEFTGKFCSTNSAYGIGAKIVRTVDGKEVEPENNYDTIEPVPKAIIDTTSVDEVVEESTDVSGKEDTTVELVKQLTKFDNINKPTKSEAVTEEVIEEPKAEDYIEEDKLDDESDSDYNNEDSPIVYSDYTGSSINSFGDALKNVSLNETPEKERRETDFKTKKFTVNDDIPDDVLNEY